MAQDFDGLPYAAKVERLLEVGLLLDLMELLWLRDLATVDARAQLAPSRVSQRPRPLPGSATDSTWTLMKPPGRSAPPEPCPPNP